MTKEGVIRTMTTNEFNHRWAVKTIKEVQAIIDENIEDLRKKYDTEYNDEDRDQFHTGVACQLLDEIYILKRIKSRLDTIDLEGKVVN